MDLYSFESLSEALQKEKGVPGAVIEQILVDRLGLKLGDTFKLGQTKFHLGGIIKSIPDSGSDGFGLGPRSIVYKDDLEGSGLLSPGTLFSTKYRLDLKDTSVLDLLADSAWTYMLSLARYFTNQILASDWPNCKFNPDFPRTVY